ncbi:MAG TPA: RiPP maturation radical SAM C-methyltransferase [Nonomuraea sp.]|nr:RiPP maturation radical SAM C-methyltransferase [Nonomuraea sp.]
MPFMDIDRPSIQLGLLAEVARAHGFPTGTLHANLDFAARIGADLYRRLYAHRGRMLGDWLFSVEAFRKQAPDPDGRLVDDLTDDDLAHLGEDPHEVRQLLRRVREQDVPAYLDDLADGYAWDDVGVVGFSCTFEQSAASFALARRLKERYPGIVTVFGGANFDGDMGVELARTIDCIDFAVIGEGEVALPLLLSALANGDDPAAVPGVAQRAGDRVVRTPPPPLLRRLDDLPVPDYGEYFERAGQLGLLPRGGAGSVWLPFESARGCWWGAKHHCTFCGLNGSAMAFRSKSAATVRDELARQSRRYGSFRFAAVDNILDPAHVKELFPALLDSATDYALFYEVKANLNRAQLRLLAQAGVRHIQPGLESLSSHVLSLMRKGVRAAQNVNVLRWSRYYGISVMWNVLWGFPGETEADYAEQTAVVSHLRHLQPPAGAGRIWLERFSPLFTASEDFGIRTKKPERSYEYVYPDNVDLDHVAYFFEYELDTGVPAETYQGLAQAVDGWLQAWRGPHRPALTYRSAPGYLQIFDGREQGRDGTYTFDGMLADIYRACSDRPVTAAAIRERLALDLPVEAVTEILIEFQRRGLMFLDGNLAVALAIPAVDGR